MLWRRKAISAVHEIPQDLSTAASPCRKKTTENRIKPIFPAEPESPRHTFRPKRRRAMSKTVRRILLCLPLLAVLGFIAPAAARADDPPNMQDYNTYLAGRGGSDPPGPQPGLQHLLGGGAGEGAVRAGAMRNGDNRHKRDAKRRPPALPSHGLTGGRRFLAPTTYRPPTSWASRRAPFRNARSALLPRRIRLRGAARPGCRPDGPRIA